MAQSENSDDDALYAKEYIGLISAYAKMAAEYPDKIEEIRELLAESARSIIGQMPESADQFKKLAIEADAFLSACLNGEIDPEQFLKDYCSQ
jgi:hypothetical protein